MRIGLAIAVFIALLAFGVSQAQECVDTPLGRICRVRQPIAAGLEVPPNTQRLLGLVTVNGGCSGTLLNRFWVLTARHCVTVGAETAGALLKPNEVRVTANAWSPDRVGRASRIEDFAVNTAGPNPVRDIVLIYLGTADLGPVDAQPVYTTTVDGRLSGRLVASDTVTQYGQGLSTFAQGVFGTNSFRPADGNGTYRSAQFTPSEITSTHYRLAMTPVGQVGHGGDSGGPSVVTRQGYGVGIAGVQSSCEPDGYVANAPLLRRRVNWRLVRGIRWCTYVSVEPLSAEIRSMIHESPEADTRLFQRHVDGSIWKYNGTGYCAADACPGWTMIDRNARSAEIITARWALFQRHVDGRIYKYNGTGECTATACPGWTEIDHNTRTAAIAGGVNGLYQRHVDGRLFRYDGIGECSPAACPGWTEIDRHPDTTDFVAARGTLFQRRAGGRILKYDGMGQCGAAGCSGWTEIDRNIRTAAIAGGSEGLYQRHVDGRIYKYDGNGRCDATACLGWTEIDRNSRTEHISASGSTLFQRHVDGRLWRYDNVGHCTDAVCPGWTEIDRNERTREISASGRVLFQRHVDGRIWKHNTSDACGSTVCAGWTEIDRNTRTSTIVAVEPF